MRHVDACLKTLPPQQERAVVLRDWLGAETEAICDELGVSANNLAVMLHRARQRLRASLQPQWRPPGAGGATAPLQT